MDEAGLYVTAAQVQFFLNRRNGKRKRKDSDPEFLKYYRNCCFYNLVYDMMDEDPSCAKMYWDPKSKSIALSFPMRGPVAYALAEVSFVFDGEGEDDDDIYGIFQ